MGFTEFDGLVYFAAYEPTDGEELWCSDGTAAGTKMVANIYAGSGSSWPYYFTAINGTLYFSAGDSTHGNELWSYTPTTHLY